MSPLQPIEPAEPTRPPDRVDQRVTLRGIRWQDYEALLAMRGESSGLGVPRAWFWQDGGLRIYLLAGGVYRQSPRSRLLPDLDPELIVRFMSYPSQTQAVRGLREALRPVL